MADLERTIAILQPSTDTLADCPMSTYAWPGLVLIVAHSVVPAALWVSLLLAWLLVSVLIHGPVQPIPGCAAARAAAAARRPSRPGAVADVHVPLRTFCTNGWSGLVVRSTP
jgi:hypothetical protein